MEPMPVFILTIDTEGDNLWSRPQTVTTENARYLPRFQALCEAFGFRPTYLVDYEMTLDAEFQAFGRAVLRRGAGEIGLHIHPWNTPPLTDGGVAGGVHAYLHELPDTIMQAKLTALTDLIEDVFATRPVSHRAGRWGFDERVARVLAGLGYLVDCSVTPGVSWRTHKGAPDGAGGPDYSTFARRPYFLDLNDIRREGPSALLEVPVTIRPNYGPALRRLHQLAGSRPAEQAFRVLFGPPASWLRPNGRNGPAMLALVDWAIHEGLPVLEFMLHSSELMPGGSDRFRTSAHIEAVYRDLEILFQGLSARGVRGMTLAQYRSTWPERGEGWAGQQTGEATSVRTRI
jgi:hypothetical protein